VLRAVPRQSLRARSKWASAPGPSGAEAPLACTIKDPTCDVSEKTSPEIRAETRRRVGRVVRHGERRNTGLAIYGYSFPSIWIHKLKNVVALSIGGRNLLISDEKVKM